MNAFSTTRPFCWARQEAEPDQGRGTALAEADKLMADRDELQLQVKQARLESDALGLPLLPLHAIDALRSGWKQISSLMCDYHPDAIWNDLCHVLRMEPDLSESSSRCLVRCAPTDFRYWETHGLLDDALADNLDFDTSLPDPGSAQLENGGAVVVLGPAVAMRQWLSRFELAADRWGVGDWDRYASELSACPRYVRYGIVDAVDGNVLKATGLKARIGDLVEVELEDASFTLAKVTADVDGKLTLVPFGADTGLSAGLRVHLLQGGMGAEERISRGRAYNAVAEPIDNLPAFLTVAEPASLPAATTSKVIPISQRLATGVRAIDLFMPLGYGQRIGIFAPPGTGKSTLMNQIVRGIDTNEVVIALVGERKRELAEFLSDDAGFVGDPKYTIVASSAEEPAPMQLRALELAVLYAGLRARQGDDVVLFVDSLTRAAQAYRTMSLMSGQAPVRRGYPAGLPGFLADHLEKGGNFRDQGSLSIICTVLTEGSDHHDDPVAESAQAIFDGHILLSHELAEQNHYPAIDILRSISRIGDRIQPDDEQQLAGEIRRNLAYHRDAKDLILLGAYQKGADPELDLAVDVAGRANVFCRQASSVNAPLNRMREQLFSIFSDLVQEEQPDE